MKQKQLTIAQFDAETPLPPMALDKFIQYAGVSRPTAYQWRKKEILKTINICGRQYVPAKEVDRFNTRAEAGEFSQEHTSPFRNQDKGAAKKLERAR